MLEALSAQSYRLHGHIDMQESSELLRELMALPQASAAGELVLDLAALDSADSLLLAALFNLQRQLLKAGGRLRVTGLPDSMRGLARVYGVEPLLDDLLENRP